MDKISQLPEAILHHILNFLETEEAARAAILSKTWICVVNSHPVLDFDEFRLCGTKSTQLDRVENFLNRIDDSIQNLLRQKLSIHKFGLKVKTYHPNAWDRWMHQLVNEANVKELCLDMSYTYYMLPPIVFCSKTITRLVLSGCEPLICDNVKLPNLRELDLRLMDSLSQEVIDNLISGSPSIEIFKLAISNELSEICISRLHRLKTVELRSRFDLAKVKIVASQLQNFEFWGKIWSVPFFEINLSACESTLKMFRLHDANVNEVALMNHFPRFWGLEELAIYWVHNLNSIEIPILRNLQRLTVQSCNKLSVVKVDAPKLKRLKIQYCYKLSMVEIDAPNLQYLNYRYNKLPFYPVNSSRLSKIKFSPRTMGLRSEFEIWCDSFNEFSPKFNQFKDIKLILSYGENVFVYEELGENFMTMLHDLIEFIEPDIAVACIGSYESLLDYLFKRHRYWQTISLVSNDRSHINELLQVRN